MGSLTDAKSITPQIPHVERVKGNQKEDRKKYRSSRLRRVLIFKMVTKGGDVKILVAIRTWDVGSDLILHLKIIKVQPIWKVPISINQPKPIPRNLKSK